MKKVLINIIIGIWLIVALFTTITLLSFNDYRVTEFGDYSIIALENDNLEPDFKKGDLIIEKKADNNDININDTIFYYSGGSNDAVINLDVVTNKEIVTDVETTFETQSGRSVSSEYVIGKSNDAQVVSDLGTVLTILQSRWGFMFIVIFPTILLFVYEIYAVVTEARRQKGKNEK